MRLLRRKIKKTDANGKIELERVIGMTTCNASGLASNAATGEVAYLAGCVVVIYNTKTNSQTRFLIANRAPKTLTCVAYSYHGGRLVAAGESGHQPAVIIWDSISGQCMTELKTHKFGISCIEFSPNGRHLVSVGVPHDGFLCLWEWKSATLLAKTRTTTVASPISSVHYASDGSFFITAGIKHLRQWSLVQARTRPMSAGSTTLEGKAINLGSQKDGSFVSISSSKDPGAQSSDIHPIYVLTNAGVLCLLHLGIAVEKWVDLKVRRGFDLAVSETHVACACSDGIVRCFVLGTLAYTATLPRPAPYGYHGLTDSNMCTALSVGRVQGINFPDAIACSFLAGGYRIAVVYGDHSLYIWDVRDFSKIGRCRTFLGHAGCIWDVASVPQFHALKSKIGKENVIGGECFATCSADGSIRLWSVGPDKDLSQAVASKSTNVYCKDILGVIYIDGKDTLKPAEQDEDSVQGFRAISVSSDGKYLASGDRCGNLRVYSLTTFDLATFQEAHDAEILSLSFGSGFLSRSEQGSPVALLASGGRDRLVHVYDVNRNFDVIETLDDHSASITGVKFACGATRLLSCSADKSVVFRQLETTENGIRSSRYHQEVAPRGTIYDMDVHPNEKLVVTVGQDKKVNILNLANGKPLRTIKPEADVGEPFKVRVDPSGTFFICSHSDKCMRLYDFATGELLTYASGHAEVITGITWLPDCKHLVSVSGDSCIFIWKLPPIMSRTMRRKLISQAEAQPPPRYLKSALKRSHMGRLTCRTSRSSTSRLTVLDDSQVDDVKPNAEQVPTFKFSVSKLPSWAQSKVEEESSESTRKTLADKSEENAQSAESRWVERVGNQGYKLATEASEETPPTTIHVSGFGARRRFSVEDSTANQDSTPESSLNSQTDGSPMSSPRDPPRRETHWKTVHTVFFDEMDFLQDGGHGNYIATEFPPDEQPNKLPGHGECEGISRFASTTGEQEDGVVVCLPEDEASKGGEEQDAILEQDIEFGNSSAFSTPRKEVSFIVASKSSDTEVDAQSKADAKENNGSPLECSNVSTGEESDGCDEDSSPCKDLFSAHFDKLSSAAKLNSSTRSSLSARFFARTTRTPAAQDQESLLEDDDVSSNPGCLLAAERERLKLQERQDKMASEVQRMRERLVNLGLAVCEGGKSEKKDLGEAPFVDTSVNQQSSTIFEPPEEITLSFNQSGGPDDRSRCSSITTESPKEACDPCFIGNISSADTEDGSSGTASDSEPAAPSPVKERILEDPTLCASPRDSSQQQQQQQPVLVNGHLPRPEKEYIAALQDLEQAAERAGKLLAELRGLTTVTSESKSDIARLTESYQNVLPDALQTMQKLADQISARALTPTLEAKTVDLITENRHIPRPGTAASAAGSDLVHSSVDIEGLLERYSTRFSENLAHQVLALVQKGLGTESK